MECCFGVVAVVVGVGGVRMGLGGFAGPGRGGGRCRWGSRRLVGSEQEEGERETGEVAFRGPGGDSAEGRGGVRPWLS